MTKAEVVDELQQLQAEAQELQTALLLNSGAQQALQHVLKLWDQEEVAERDQSQE